MREFKLTLSSLGELISQLTRALADSDKPLKVTISEWREKRSLPANAQYYKWLPSIAEFYGEDVDFVRKWMKHSIAWPILERGNSEYSNRLRWLLNQGGYDNLPVEKQINMIDMFQITKLMNSKEHTMLRDELQIYWAKQGLQLNYLNGGNRGR